MTEHKLFEPELKAAGDDGSARFVVAHLNQIDKDGDVTLPGFFGTQNVVMVPSHDWSHVPIGKGVVREEGNRAVVDVKFNLAIPAARDWHEAIKFDMAHPPSLQEYSYGFTIKSGGSSRGDFNGQRVRFLQPLKDGSPGSQIHEVSPVLIGAGVGTHTLAVKHDDGTAAVFAEARRHLAAIEASEAAAYAEMKAIHDRFERDQMRQIQHRLETSIIKDDVRRRSSIYYSESAPPPEPIRKAAEATLRLCATELGITPPPLMWMLEENTWEKVYEVYYGDRDWPHIVSDEPLLGAFHKATGTVWVRSDLGFEQTLALVAHEVRHAAGGDENEARAYEKWWASRLPKAN